MSTREPIRSADGTDVTEAIQVIYDLAHSSMDWGSGMLSTEEVEAVIRFAIHMGWGVPQLDGFNGTQVVTARKFPDHYSVTERACKWSPGGIRYDVVTKEQE